MAINVIESPQICTSRTPLVNDILRPIKMISNYPGNGRKHWKITKINWKWPKIAESRPKPVIQTLKIYVNWSPLVDAKGVDNHRLRNLTFYEQSNGDSDFVSLTLNYGYNFTPRAKLYAEYVYTVYEEAKADTKLVNNTTGQVSYSPNSAGLDNENSTVSVGIKLIF